MTTGNATTAAGLVLYRCRRCGELHEVPVQKPSVTLREAVERGATLEIHGCADGALGVADIVGTGPGRPPAGPEPESSPL